MEQIIENTEAPTTPLTDEELDALLAKTFVTTDETEETDEQKVQ